MMKTVNTSALLPSGKILAPTEMLKNHVNPVISKAGFKISRDEPWLGASPDGYIECKCCGRVVIEAKCPYKWASQSWTIEDICSDKSGNLTQSRELKPSHQYYALVQLQMHVCKVLYCQFITWTPTLGVLTVVKRDEPFIAMMLEKLNSFWEKNILPTLLATSQDDAMDEQQSDDKEIFCKCQQ